MRSRALDPPLFSLTHFSIFILISSPSLIFTDSLGRFYPPFFTLFVIYFLLVVFAPLVIGSFGSLVALYLTLGSRSFLVYVALRTRVNLTYGRKHTFSIKSDLIINYKFKTEDMSFLFVLFSNSDSEKSSRFSKCIITSIFAQ